MQIINSIFTHKYPKLLHSSEVVYFVLQTLDIWVTRSKNTTTIHQVKQSSVKHSQILFLSCLANNEFQEMWLHVHIFPSLFLSFPRICSSINKCNLSFRSEDRTAADVSFIATRLRALTAFSNLSVRVLFDFARNVYLEQVDEKITCKYCVCTVVRWNTKNEVSKLSGRREKKNYFQ